MSLRECCFRTIPENGRKVVWEITYQCGYGCDYCFQAQKRDISQVTILSKNDLLKICDALPSFNAEDVLITGGEILFVEDSLLFIAQKLASMGLTFSFSTASLFNEDFLTTLASYAPRAINISFDPCSEYKENIHAREYSAVKKLLAIAHEACIQVKITGVVHKANIKQYTNYLAEIKELLDEFDSLSSVYITNPYDIGYLKQNIRISKTEQIRVVREADKYSDERIKLINFPLRNNCLQKCPAGSIINIDPLGNVYPCHLLANVSNDDYYKMGNLLQDSVVFILNRVKSFVEQVSDAITESKERYEECSSCKNNAQCGGGCIAEGIAAGNMVEMRLFCKKIPYPDKKIHQIASTFTHNMSVFTNNLDDITEEEEEKIRNYILNNLSKKQHDLAHGFDHVLAVVGMAREIAKQESANLRIVTIAAYFHDYAPRRKLLFESHSIESAEQATSYLRENGYDEFEIEQVYECIDRCTYGAEDMGLLPVTKEAKCVHDADLLDAVGARGIARVFAFGAAHKCETLGLVEWDIDNPPKEVMSQVGPDPSPIYHFFSKLLWVKDRVKTKTGKQMAQERHQVMINFLKDYKAETDLWSTRFNGTLNLDDQQ